MHVRGGMRVCKGDSGSRGGGGILGGMVGTGTVSLKDGRGGQGVLRGMAGAGAVSLKGPWMWGQCP